MSANNAFMISIMLFFFCIGAAFMRRRKIVQSAYEPKGKDNLPAYDFFMDLFSEHQKAINRNFALYSLLFLVLNAINIIWQAQSDYQQYLEWYTDASWFDGNVEEAEEKARSSVRITSSISFFLECIILLFFIWTFVGTYLNTRIVKKRLGALQRLNVNLDVAQSDYISNRGNPMKAGLFWDASIIFGNHFLFDSIRNLIIPYNDILKIYKNSGNVLNRYNGVDTVNICCSQSHFTLAFDPGLSNSHKKMEDFCTALKKKGVNI